MTFTSTFKSALICGAAAASLMACAHTQPKADAPPLNMAESAYPGLKAAPASGPILLLLKADPKRVEKVQYFHKARSTSYEDVEVRHQKVETLEFSSQAETKKVEDGGAKFTQVLSVLKKDGAMNLHDFAMPELGEKLEITADSHGTIIKAGDYPPNSIFYVAPISLPEKPVEVGDTWSMSSDWLSLEEQVPYHLEMTSIFKKLLTCGAHRCAQVEISGEVTLEGALVQMMAFKSLWKGFLIFDIDAGTVVWSRVDSEEQFASGNVRRSVTSCLEASLFEPEDEKLPGRASPPCEKLAEPGDITPIPTPIK